LSKLILVRHGVTNLQQHDERFWGSTDVKLSSAGVRQAELLSDRLAKEKINAVYSSVLSRARTTAEIIALRHKLDVISCPELNECNFGYAEGLTFTEIQRLHPELAKTLKGFDTAVRFPGGESFIELDNRVQQFLNRLDAHTEKETLVIVAHGGTLLLLICHLLEIDIKHWRQMRLYQASMSIMDTYPEGAILSLLNDVSHLTK
jgi:broad specificity phosphatase PhoE